MLKKKIRISVIVPIYNIESYLEKCVISIIQQSYVDLQIILVDDGSKDSSGRLADFYATCDQRIQVIHKENGGLVSARKAGMEVARGDYIYFIDGDDWIDRDTIECMVNCLEENEDVDMVLFGYKEDICGKVYFRKNQLAASIYMGKKLQENVFRQPLTQGDFYVLNIQPFLWNKLIRRELAIPHIQSMNERICIGEDVAIMLPMLLSAKKIIVSEECKYHYCMRLSSMMHHRENLNKERDGLKILHQYLLDKVWMYERGLQKTQISKFTMNNILTRIYPQVADRNGKNRLWPFPRLVCNGDMIIYGAGNFGQAVYSYLYQKVQHNIVLWVDQKFQEYQAMNIPVDDPQRVIYYTKCDVLIAILDMAAVNTIIDFLLSKGFERKRIHSIFIPLNEISKVLHDLEFE